MQIATNDSKLKTETNELPVNYGIQMCIEVNHSDTRMLNCHTHTCSNATAGIPAHTNMLQNSSGNALGVLEPQSIAIVSSFFVFVFFLHISQMNNCDVVTVNVHRTRMQNSRQTEYSYVRACVCARAPFEFTINNNDDYDELTKSHLH